MINSSFIDSVLGLGVDERVRMLVVTLNDLPGISTISCCGGHENPRGSQVKSDSFYVALSVEMNRNRPSKKGWRSLGIIERATTLCEISYMQEYGEKDARYFNIIMCNLTDCNDEESLYLLDFEIHGRFGADPNVLANQIIEEANAL